MLIKDPLYIENKTSNTIQIILFIFLNTQPPSQVQSSSCYYCKIPSLSPTRHLCSGSVRSPCGLQKAQFWQQRHQAIAFEGSGSNEELDDDISYAAINSSSRLLKSGRASSLAVPSSGVPRSNLQRKRHYSYSEKGK